MRCSSCEPLLDDYLEGSLHPRQMRTIAHHLRRCASCEAFLNELRVVDALLATARPPGSVDSEFTESVVSATRGAAPHRIKRFSPWPTLAAYLVVAWGLFAFAATRTGVLAGWLNAFSSDAWRGLAAIAAALRAIAPASPAIAAALTAVLLLDLFLLFAVLYGYRRLRPMLAVYLARSPRS
ncbi:MAG TPA: zf-HC2 domain-containing protein [Candidatus Cybelea sp.]|jgi:hypothetical protein|nr:zf-HC2 domain-containing protein [Candidatus Cybelea sp.]